MPIISIDPGFLRSVLRSPGVVFSEGLRIVKKASAISSDMS